MLVTIGWLVVLTVVSLYAVPAWTKSLHRREGFSRAPRGIVLWVGAAFTAASLAVLIGTVVYAVFRPFPFYDPTLLRLESGGFYAGMVGAIASVIGKGMARRATIVSSVFCSAAWFILGASEF